MNAPKSNTGKDVFCVMPFIHLNLLANGQASVCCVSNVPLPALDGRPYNVRTHALPEIWNSPALRLVRRQLLNNEPPIQCANCYVTEKHGFGSDRMDNNRRFLAAEGDPPDERRVARPALYEIADMPWSFDLRFDNLCNLKCVICTGEASSMIENDPVQQAWVNAAPIVRQPNRFHDRFDWVNSPELFDEVVAITRQVRFVQLAGGEPFLSRLGLHWLEHMNASGRAREVAIKVYTNFTRFDDDVVRLLSGFAEVELILSIDGTEAVYEYVRFPGKWKTIADNARDLVARLKDRLTNTKVWINATMSMHSCFGITRVFDFAKAHGFGAKLSYADGPIYVSCAYLPAKAKDALEQRLRAYADANPEFPVLAAEIDRWMDYIRAIDITAPEHAKIVQDVMRFVNDIDAVRGTDIREAVPELRETFAAHCGRWDAGHRFLHLRPGG